MGEVTLFNNERAEAAVLAAFMQDADLSTKILTLQEKDFVKPENRDLFCALRQIAVDKGDTTDLVTLSDTLNRMYGERETALTQLAIQYKNETIGAKRTFNKHTEIVRAASTRRQLFDIFDRGKEALRRDEETSVVLEKARQSLRDVVTASDGWMTIGDVLSATYKMLERRSKGEEPIMPSGIGKLDRLTSGFHRGELTIIGARPSVGKSAFAMFCALEIAKRGYKVSVCSREMSDEQYGTRIFQSGTDVSSYKMKTGELSLEDWTQLAEAMGYFQNLPVTFLFNTKNVEDLRAEVQRRVDTDGLDLLVVDYTQLMRTRQRFDADYQRIGYITKMLKDMTTDFKISIIALAQVGRSAAGDMPSLEELRGSGDMEQDGDNVFFLYRPEAAEDENVKQEHRSLFDTLEENGKQYIVLEVAKQRQGTLGRLAMVFDPEKMRYLGIED